MGLADRDYMRERANNRASDHVAKPKHNKVRAWLLWHLMFWPLMLLSWGAAASWGWIVVIPLLFAFAGASMLAARYGAGKSWTSILWGEHD